MRSIPADRAAGAAAAPAKADHNGKITLPGCLAACSIAYVFIYRTAGGGSESRLGADLSGTATRDWRLLRTDDWPRTPPQGRHEACR